MKKICNLFSLFVLVLSILCGCSFASRCASSTSSSAAPAASKKPVVRGVLQCNTSSSGSEQKELVRELRRNNDLLYGLYRLLHGLISLTFLTELAMWIFYLLFGVVGMESAVEFAAWAFVGICFGVASLVYASGRQLYGEEEID